MNSNLIVQRVRSMILMIAGVMFFSSFTIVKVWACDCEQTITVTDGGCSSNFNCANDRTGCQSTNFTASCSGWYTFKVWLQSENCASYNVCADLYDNSGQHIGFNCHINPCSDCAANCGQVSYCGVSTTCQ
jgi:hypothetical protein